MRLITELRELSTDDLKAREAELKESLFRMRFKQSLGDLEAVKGIAKGRKQLARVKTLLRARRSGIEH